MYLTTGPSFGWPWTCYILAGAPDLDAVRAVVQQFMDIEVERFATWLAAHHADQYGLAVTPQAQAPGGGITADAIAEYLHVLEQRGLAASTVKKDGAATTALPATCTPCERSTPPRSS